MIHTPPSRRSRAAPAYHPGHPWYYLPRGNNRPPLAVREIAPSRCPGFSGRDFPKDEPRREHRLREPLHAEESCLADTVTRYDDIAARRAHRGSEAVHRPITSGTRTRIQKMMTSGK